MATLNPLDDLWRRWLSRFFLGATLHINYLEESGLIGHRFRSIGIYDLKIQPRMCKWSTECQYDNV
jgi:hypothetical protein